MPYPRPEADVPELDTTQMVEVDRIMIEDLRIGLLQMMENAGRALASLARRRFLKDPRGKKVVVLAGRGGNGGGVLTAARRLANWGAEISIVLVTEAREFEGVPSRQLDILSRMGITPGEPGPADLILDGLIGYSLRGSPKGRAAELILWANATTSPVLSLDVPSGMDTQAGILRDPAIFPDATLTLGLPKIGAHPGELYLADISVPPSVYARIGVEVGPLFAEHDILRLR